MPRYLKGNEIYIRGLEEGCPFIAGLSIHIIILSGKEYFDFQVTDHLSLFNYHLLFYFGGIIYMLKEDCKISLILEGMDMDFKVNFLLSFSLNGHDAYVLKDVVAIELENSNSVIPGSLNIFWVCFPYWQIIIYNCSTWF